MDTGEWLGQAFESMNPFARGVLFVAYLTIVVGSIVGLNLPVWLLYRKVPKYYRKIPAWTAFLLFVPCLGLVFYWILIPFRIPESLREWFTRTSPGAAGAAGDFGAGLGMAAAITMSMSIIPYVGLCSGPIYLVLHIMYLVKMRGYLKLGVTPEPAAEFTLRPPLDPNNPYGRS